MKREHGGVKIKEFKGAELSHYAVDAVVVVNRVGSWVEAKLTAPGEVKNDKLVLELDFGDGPETITVSEPPEVVAFKTNDTIVDGLVSTKGDTFTIESSAIINKDGSIEYSVKQPDGSVIKGVPQEFLEAWKKVLKLEKKVKDKQADLESLPKLYRRNLTEQRNAVTEEIANLNAEIPELVHMPNFDPGAIELIASKLEGLHKKAASAVSKFERAVQSAKDTVEPDKHKDVSDYEFFEETEQEVKDRKEKAEEYKKYKKAVRESVATLIAEENSKIDGERETELALEIVAKKAEYDAAVAAANANPQGGNQGGGRGNNQPARTPMPPRFDRRLITLPATREKEFADRKAGVVKQKYLELFGHLEKAANNQGDLHAKELLDELTKERRELAGKDIASPTATFTTPTGETYVDYENDPPNHLDQSLYVVRNREILTKLIADAPIPDGPKAKEGQEVFDFNKRVKELREEAHRLLAMIPREGDDKEKAVKKVEKKPEKKDDHGHDEHHDEHGDHDEHAHDAGEAHGHAADNAHSHEPDESDPLKTPKKGYEDLYKKIHADLDALAYTEKLFANLKSAEGTYSGIDQAGLQAKRVEQITEIENLLNEVELKIQTKLDHDRHHGAKEKFAEKREAKDRKLDIPSSLVEELLRMRPNEAKHLAKVLLEGGVNNKNQVNADTLAAAKNLFDKAEPNNPGLLALLEQHNISDWKVFKKLWDEKMAGQAVIVLNKALEGNMRSRLSKEISLRDKANTIAGQVAARVLMTAGLVTGAVIGTTALAAATIGTGGVAGLAATVVGGAAGGAARGWLNKKIFESNFMKNRTERLMKEMEEKKRKEITDKVLDEWFGTGNATSNSSNKVDLEGLPSFAAIISEVVHELSGEAQKAANAGPKPLSGDAETMYENALARLEVEPDEKTKMELRLAITRLQSEGNRLTDSVTRNVDPKIISVLEGVLKNYSGKNGVAAAAVSGAAMAVAFSASNEYARMAVGAATGLVAGWKEGDRREKAAELKETTKAIREKIESVRRANELAINSKDLNAAFALGDRKEYQDQVMDLKRLIHGTALNSELAAVCKVTIGEDGEKHIEPDVALITLIKATVKDAERLGVYQEQAQDRMKAKKVLETLQNAGDALQEKQHPEPGFWKKFGKYAKKTGYAVLGATAGATAALAIGNGVNQLKEIWSGDHTAVIVNTDTGEQFDVAGLSSAQRLEILDSIRGGHKSLTEMLAMHMAAAEHVDHTTETKPASQSAQAEEKVSGVSSRANTLPETQSAEVAPEKDTVTPEIAHAPETPVVREIGIVEVSRGGSALGTLNKIDDLKPAGLSAEAQAKWEDTMHDKNNFQAWKIEQLKENGYVFKDGKWGHPQTLHAGAKMEVTYDEGTKEFNARFVHGEDDHITEHKFYQFQKTGEFTEADAKAVRAQTAKFASEVNGSIRPMPKFEIDQKTVKTYSGVDGQEDYKIGSPVKDEFGNPKLVKVESHPINVFGDKTLVAEAGGAGDRFPGIMSAEPIHDGQLAMVKFDNGKSLVAFPTHDAANQAWTLKGVGESPIMKAAETDLGGRGKFVSSEIPVPKTIGVEARGGGSGTSSGGVERAVVKPVAEPQRMAVEARGGSSNVEQPVTNKAVPETGKAQVKANGAENNVAKAGGPMEGKMPKGEVATEKVVEERNQINPSDNNPAGVVERNFDVKAAITELTELKNLVAEDASPQQINYLGEGEKVYQEFLKKIDQTINQVQTNPRALDTTTFDSDWLFKGFSEDEKFLFAADFDRTGFQARGHALMFKEGDQQTFWYDSTKNFTVKGNLVVIQELGSDGQTTDTYKARLTLDPETNEFDIVRVP